jgi:trypsin
MHTFVGFMIKQLRPSLRILESGDIDVRTNGQPTKSRAKPRNNAQFHRDAKNTRGMDFIGRVSDDVRNRELGTRIVGGTAAGGGEFKFFASWDVGCGGSLIAPNMILTAAHCADQSNGSVRIGSNSYGSGGITRRVKNQCMHPNYDESISAYDFMILTLDSPVDTTKFPVIKLNNDRSLPKTDAMLTVIGFGATKEGGSQSNTLLKVDVPANSHKLCLAQYNWVKEAVHLCAGFTGGGKDSCQGDSAAQSLK